MRVLIIFENDTVFDWHMYDNDFVNRWVTMLQEHVANVPDAHDYELTLQGLGPADEFKRLNKIIDKCNEHRANTIPDHYVNKAEYTLQELSEVHYIYEEIAQQPEWLNGSLNENDAIKVRDLLNDFIHQAESRAGSNLNLQKRITPRVRFRIVNPETGVPNARKEDFQDSDYNLFDPIVHPSIMYLNYNAVGEDFIKTYKSEREPKDAMPLRQFSPSFFFVLHAIDYDTQFKRIERCKQWMQQGGFDPADPMNSFGYIPMGTLFKSENDSVYENALLKSKIKKVVIL